MATYYYNVKNRSGCIVTYMIPEMNITRRFAIGEAKKIAYDELLQLSFQPGGRELMANFLQIQSVGVPKTLGINTQPEYYMSEQDIIDLIKTGSLDAFLDCLDYAPEGVIELLKKFSISIPLTDFQKREALLKKTGFDVDSAIKNMTRDVDNTTTEEPASNNTTAPKGRRTTPTYNIVKQG